jgi:hypothetical protein
MCALAIIFVQQTPEGDSQGERLSLLLCLLSCRSKKVSPAEGR